MACNGVLGSRMTEDWGVQTMPAETKLDEESLTPLYQQVMEEIKRGIEDGTYSTGEKIPSEAELSEMYSVSRITIRRAVEELVGEGLLTKRQGKGTYVTRRRLQRKITQESDVQSFSESCRVNGFVPGAHIIERELMPANHEVQEFLGISPGDQVIHIRRVRTADGVPIMLETNYYPRDRCAFLMEEDLEDVSVFDVLEQHLGIRPESSDPTTVEIVLATASTAEPLGVRVGEPLFFMNTHIRGGDGTPLFVGHQYIVGSRYVFTI